MSRARHIEGIWFDRRRDGRKASVEQLDALAAISGIEIDDLLDEGLTQKQTWERLNALNGNVIPPEVLEAHRQRRVERQRKPECRICTALDTECEGRITRHHFIPRWLMLELENYNSYSSRRVCTIPICVGRHRDLHIRGDEDTPKSIGQFLREGERELAQRMLDDLHEQRPHIFDLILGGDAASYEYQLARDYSQGLFAREVPEQRQESAAGGVTVIEQVAPSLAAEA